MSNFLKNLHPLFKRQFDNRLSEDESYALIRALNEEMDEVEQDTIQSKLQSSLKTATTSYLDKFGDWFGLYRKRDEKDDKYRERLIKYLLLKRGTNHAIIEGIKYYLDRDDIYISIYEPYTNIFFTNKSSLNSKDNLMGKYYRFAVINVTIGDYFPVEIIDIINQFKPSGVQLFVTYDDSYNSTSTNRLHWLENSFSVSGYTDIINFEGYDESFYGHINLSLMNRNYIPNVSMFFSNNSLINSQDVLSGYISTGRQFFNTASISSKEYVPDINDTVVSVLAQNDIQEMDTGFYLQTSKKDNNYSSVTLESSNDPQYLNLNFSLRDYMLINKPEIPINDIPSITSFITDLSVNYTLKGNMGPGRSIYFEVQFYNFKTDSWVTISSSKVSHILIDLKTKVGNINNYVCLLYTSDAADE